MEIIYFIVMYKYKMISVLGMEGEIYLFGSVCCEL